MISKVALTISLTSHALPDLAPSNLQPASNPEQMKSISRDPWAGVGTAANPTTAAVTVPGNPTWATFQWLPLWRFSSSVVDPGYSTFMIVSKI